MMVQYLGQCIGLSAPYYNLALVIVLIALFIYLFRIPNKHKVDLKPWVFLLIALCIFIFEEVITVLRTAGIISFPRVTFGVFEMIMITLFIYMTLSQRKDLKK